MSARTIKVRNLANAEDLVLTVPSLYEPLEPATLAKRVAADAVVSMDLDDAELRGLAVALTALVLVRERAAQAAAAPTPAAPPAKNGKAVSHAR